MPPCRTEIAWLRSLALHFSCKWSPWLGGFVARAVAKAPVVLATLIALLVPSPSGVNAVAGCLCQTANAVTGSKWDARRAGTIPDTKPTMIEQSNAARMNDGDP